MMAMMVKACCILLAFLSVCRGLRDDEVAAFKAREFQNKNTGVQGTIEIKSNDDTSYLITSNGIPDHATGSFDGSRVKPNRIQQKEYSWLVPKSPERSDTTKCLPMGPIGVAINGVPIYNPYTLTCCDAGTAELNLFDECWGHPSPTNSYHYHTAPLCLMKNICNKTSSIIGVAFDGYPIYGPYDEYGQELRKQDLDECNGKYIRDGSQYRYHITGFFPYFMKCYRGKVIPQEGMNENCDCTEPATPCEEGPEGKEGGELPKSDKNEGEKHGLTKTGHFYCCNEGDDECPYITNVNTIVPTLLKYNAAPSAARASAWTYQVVVSLLVLARFAELL